MKSNNSNIRKKLKSMTIGSVPVSIIEKRRPKFNKITKLQSILLKFEHQLLDTIISHIDVLHCIETDTSQDIHLELEIDWEIDSPQITVMSDDFGTLHCTFCHSWFKTPSDLNGHLENCDFVIEKRNKLIERGWSSDDVRKSLADFDQNLFKALFKLGESTISVPFVSDNDDTSDNSSEN